MGWEIWGDLGEVMGQGPETLGGGDGMGTLGGLLGGDGMGTGDLEEAMGWEPWGDNWMGTGDPGEAMGWGLGPWGEVMGWGP